MRSKHLALPVSRHSGEARISVFCLAIILFLHPPTAVAQRAMIVPPEIGKSISLTFEPALHSAGNFRSIEINSVGGSFHFVPKVPIARIPEDADEKLSRGLWDKVSGLRLDPSHFFFRGEYISDAQPHTLLFFVSEPVASDASPLFVIGFSYVGEPYKVLELDNLNLTAFQQAGDNTAIIIGKQSLSEVMGESGAERAGHPYATTYDPFSVFIVHVEGKANYSLAASRRYNEEHYVWAGPHSREDYAVFYNLPKHPKPFGAPASRVDELLGSGKTPSPK
jgi:hypothetical protein